MTRPTALLLPCLCLGLLHSACAGPQRLHLQPATRLPPRNLVLFFVDGMDREHSAAMLQQGLLPGIQEHFVDRGAELSNVIVSMPAVTYPNSASLLTGCFPGHHGVLGNTWFDRADTQLAEYLHLDSFFTVNRHILRPTIHELLSDRLTCSVQFHTRRGVTRSFDNLIPAGVDWYLHDFSGVDRRVGQSIWQVAAEANRRRNWPVLTVFYFPGVDATAHRFGSESDEYTAALQVADQAIDTVCSAIRGTALAETTTFALVTDHNHVQATEQLRFDVGRWLTRNNGLRVWNGRLRAGSRRGRLQALRHADAIVINEAGRRAVLHLRGDDWTVGPRSDVIRQVIGDLIVQPAVALAATRGGPDTVLVFARSGCCRIERRRAASGKAYRLLNELGDALGYLADPDLRRFVADGWHDSRAWLRATDHTDYPDCVPQIVEMFDSPRAGDVVLFAAGQASFDDDRSGHGSALARDMRVRIFLAGPDIPQATYPTAVRGVDIMPTVLDLLGEHHRLRNIEPIDGRSFADMIRRGPGVIEPTAPRADPTGSESPDHLAD